MWQDLNNPRYQKMNFFFNLSKFSLKELQKSKFFTNNNSKCCCIFNHLKGKGKESGSIDG